MNDESAFAESRDATTWLAWLMAAVLFALTFAVFSRVLVGEFLMWDDNVQLLDNPRLGGLSMQRLIWAFTDFETASRYIPLTLLGWVFTFQIWSRNPFGYHLGNLLLHCGSVAVSLAVIAAMLRAAGQSAKHKAQKPRRPPSTDDHHPTTAWSYPTDAQSVQEGFGRFRGRRCTACVTNRPEC